MTETIKISQLPNVGVMSGAERMVVVQGGVTKVATSRQVADLYSGPGGGTVTSVGLSAPAMFTVSGSPVTTSGTLGLTLANQASNLVLSGPASGADAAPTFRALVGADLPFSGLDTISLVDDEADYVVVRDATTTSYVKALSKYLGYTPRGTDVYLRTIQDTLRETASVLNFIPLALHAGILDGTNTTDLTEYLINAFEAGGDLYFPQGRYFIEEDGPDSGGASVVITKSIRVVCHPEAVFYTDGVDNDMIRLAVPSNGAGLPTNLITVEWHGGQFDQTNQKVSTSVPFFAQYPPPLAKQGASATCDGLSIRLSYTDGGGNPQAGASLLWVTGVKTYGGPHWETAGGDSGLFLSGALNLIAEGNQCRGNRDLGIYISRDVGGPFGGRVAALNNQFESCFYGVAIKRNFSNYELSGNTGVNCVVVVTTSYITSGNGFIGGSIHSNTGYNCNQIVRAQYASQCGIFSNHSYQAGAYLEDGTTAVSLANALIAINLEGSSYCRLWGNTGIGVTAAATAAFASRPFLVMQDMTGPVVSTYNVARDNFCDGWRSLGSDTGNYNSFIRNYGLNLTITSISFSGTGGYEERIDATLNQPIFRYPVQFNNGSAAAPIIARQAESDTGIFFAVDVIGFSAAGVERGRFDTSGLSVVGRMLATGGSGAVQSYNTTNSATVQALVLEGDRSSPTAADKIYASWQLSNDAGTQFEFARTEARATDVVAGSEDGQIRWHIAIAGSLTDRLTLDTGTLRPSANGVLNLGSGSFTYGSLFLNTGGAVNWQNGNVTLTHATNLLSLTSPLVIGSGTAIPAGGTAGLGLRVSSTSNFGVFFGSGAPTLAAAQGSLYLRSDGTTTNDRAYINTNGTTGWTAITTAT